MESAAQNIAPTSCPNKELCGSCGWSHIPYENQLQQKLSDINGSFALKELDYQCEQISPSPKISHYRNRMDFVINFQGDVGLRQKGKWWRVIDNHPCFIADEEIDVRFHLVRDWVRSCGLSFFDRKKHVGFLRYAVIRRSPTGSSLIIIVTSKPKDKTEENVARQALASLSDQLEGSSVVWSVNTTSSDVSFGQELHTISGEGVLREQIAGFQYLVEPHAFFQTNSYAAPVLLDVVRSFCGDLSDKSLLDLYCGSGFFSIALAAEAKSAVGIELVPEAIAAARRNADLNEVSAKYLDPVKAEDSAFASLEADIVVVDPPRAGMHEKALQELNDFAPKEIVYVSCNPKSFAHAMLTLKDTYEVSDMRAVDMFPHTHHVELVTKLTKKQS